MVELNTMDTRLAFVLFLFCAVVVMGNPHKRDICNVKSYELSDCGWIGIDQVTCEARGCCWNSSLINKPYCYRPKSALAPTCLVNPQKKKTDCGWFGIDQSACEKRGCCWEPNDQDQPWCYVKDFDVPPYAMCPVAPDHRQDCGYYGIGKDECVKNNTCCWDDTIDGAKFCFHQPAIPPNSPKGCYIYHGISGACKYVCNSDETFAYGLCAEQVFCCYKGYGQRSSEKQARVSSVKD